MDNTITLDSVSSLSAGNQFTLANVYETRKWWAWLMFWKSRKLKRFTVQSVSSNLITYQGAD